MRKTLHTVSLALAPILHQATLAFRIADLRRQYVLIQTTKGLIAVVRDQILQALEESPLSAGEIKQEVLRRVGKKTGISPLLIATVLKELWEEGTLCYLNLSDRWGGEERRYGILRREFPNLDLNRVDPESAERVLVAAHVSSYGPVTVKDIAWWSGLSSRRVSSILSTLRKSITPVYLHDFADEFFINDNDLEWIVQSTRMVEPWAELLAFEDPSLKGYFQSRRRYVRDKFASRLFNKIGEAKASIVCSGEIVGTWDWDRAHRWIRLRPFERLTALQTQFIRAAVARLAAFLEAETVDGQQWVVEGLGKWRGGDNAGRSLHIKTAADSITTDC